METEKTDIVREQLKKQRWDFDNLLALSRVLPLLKCRPFRYKEHGALHYDITYRGLRIQSRHFNKRTAMGA